jgi:aspartyl-tRNA(Asn)/glutamyl-tRNA(Gln) amidotransferase subunit A
VTEVALPHTPHAIATYYLVATAEASSNLGRYDGVRFGHRAAGVKTLQELYARSRSEGFGKEVQRRIMLGTFALSAGYYEAWYGKAQKVRTLIVRDFEKAFESVDVLALPTSPVPPFKLGEKLDDPLKMYLVDALTLPCSLAGLPGLSLPNGFTADGLPLGLQLIGKAFDEATLFRAAWAYEHDHPHGEKAPGGFA